MIMYLLGSDSNRCSPHPNPNLFCHPLSLLSWTVLQKIKLGWMQIYVFMHPLLFLEQIITDLGSTFGFCINLKHGITLTCPAITVPSLTDNYLCKWSKWNDYNAAATIWNECQFQERNFLFCVLSHVRPTVSHCVCTISTNPPSSKF